MTPEEKAKSIQEKYGFRYKKLMNEALKLLELPRTLDWKAKRMLEITTEITKLIMPFSPCKKGCANCCYQSTILSSWEAGRISYFTNKKIRDFEGYNPEKDSREKMIEKYRGKICPFLAGSECTIYEVRSLICRTHISVADDPTPCDIKNNPGAKVPYFDFSDLNAIQGFLFVINNCKFGDIRDFFE